MSFGTKRPKYKLDLNINELSNIPQVTGECYIDVQVRDNNKLKSFLTFRALSLKGNNKSEDDSTPSLVKNPEANALLGSGGNISLTTSSKKIHNFKCSFNYHVSCNMKFAVKRRENLIADKFLLMKIYYVGEKHKEFGMHHSENRLELGKLEINLSEYLNFNEPVTSKYLLKDSKVNSILNLTIHLSELPANFDFHTQLQVKDSTNNHHEMNARSTAQAAHNTSNQYNIPQFERKNIFGGLNDVIGNEKKGRLSTESSRRDVSVSSEDGKSKPGAGRKSQYLKTNDQAVANNYDSTVLIDPMVNDLYKKILESTWDPKLHLLLDFTPEICINSLFDDTIPQWKQKLKEQLADDDENDDEVRCIHGLVNETNFREDLRSWSVKNIS